MDWNTLISVVIGGLIATFGSILNNRFQSGEREKDRQEQRREAKIRMIENTTGHDIDIVLNLLAGLVKALSENSSHEYKAFLLAAQLEKSAISADE
jgi:hypothetical protein